MDGLILQLGVGGIFAVLIIREFVNMMAKMKEKNGSGNENGNGTLKDVKNITIDTNDKVKSLHSLHTKYDSDGKPLWYFPGSMLENQKQIALVQERTAGHLRDMSRNQTVIVDKLKSIEDKVTH